jgi:hypothetical protein
VSQENVARYVRSVDAWNRGAPDEWLEGTVTPGWELVTGGTFPDLAPIYRGREGALEMWFALMTAERSDGSLTPWRWCSQ